MTGGRKRRTPPQPHPFPQCGPRSPGWRRTTGLSFRTETVGALKQTKNRCQSDDMRHPPTNPEANRLCVMPE